MKTETVTEALRAAPPASVGSLIMLGYPLEHWILMGTALYTLFLLIDKLPVVIQRLHDFWRWMNE